MKKSPHKPDEGDNYEFHTRPITDEYCWVVRSGTEIGIHFDDDHISVYVMDEDTQRIVRTMKVTYEELDNEEEEE